MTHPTRLTTANALCDALMRHFQGRRLPTYAMWLEMADYVLSLLSAQQAEHERALAAERKAGAEWMRGKAIKVCGDKQVYYDGGYERLLSECIDEIYAIPLASQDVHDGE